ncbi:MAG: hypothetical protein AB7D07_11540 [Desulfovibrionaceae bacterium]
MNRLDHLIKRLFRELLDVFNSMDTTDDADKSTVFLESAVNILQGILEAAEFEECEKSTWVMNDTEHLDVESVSVSFLGLRDVLSLNCGRRRMLISDHDRKHFESLFRLLKAKRIGVGGEQVLYYPFSIVERLETKSDIGIRSGEIHIQGLHGDEFYIDLITSGMIDTEDDFDICPFFNMCEWDTFTKFVRSIIIHYVSYNDHMGLVRVCSNCGKLNLKKRINKDPNSFCDNEGKCKNAYHRSRVPPHELCMQNVKEYYSTMLVDVIKGIQDAYSEDDFPLSKSICQKCVEAKPITSPEDCPVMKSDEKIQMLISMHKAG